MNDELKTRLIKYLDYLEEVGAKGADFVADQAPETVRQFVQWEIVYHGTCASACLLVILVAAFANWRFTKWISKQRDPWEFGAIYMANIFLIFPVAGICANVPPALKAYIAPNVFLIEKAAELIK